MNIVDLTGAAYRPSRLNLVNDCRIGTKCRLTPAAHVVKTRLVLVVFNVAMLVLQPQLCCRNGVAFFAFVCCMRVKLETIGRLPVLAVVRLGMLNLVALASGVLPVSSWLTIRLWLMWLMVL